MTARHGKPPAPRARLVTAGVVAAALLALIVVATATSSTQPAPAPVADTDALPAAVTVASAQTPDDLITTAGRRLHVTRMQGHPAATPCQAASDLRAADGLVVNRPVRIAAPDAAHADDPAAVPPGFQPVVLTLPDGRDYAQAWVGTSAAAVLTACPLPSEATSSSESPVRTTTSEAPTPSSSGPDSDVARSCPPGERDGERHGYCGESR